LIGWKKAVIGKSSHRLDFYLYIRLFLLDILEVSVSADLELAHSMLVSYNDSVRMSLKS
jgi:hypothetical protein